MRGPYLYPNTEILINKHCIKDEKILSEMEAEYASLRLKEIAENFSRCLTKLWKIHEFHEGNTRMVVTFCCQFADSKGFPIVSKLFEENSAYVRTSLVAASAIFKDLGNKSKPEYLIRIVRDSLEKSMSKTECKK
ncbi:MAG TPA: hypothetical protein VFC41_04050 [Anaerovoracaceae bacterium]|nr:hypothetical protein [Anaerovoracaceae bacterium]